MSVSWTWASVENMLRPSKEEPSSNNLPKDKNSSCLETRNSKLPKLSDQKPKPRQPNWSTRQSKTTDRPKSRLRNCRRHETLPKFWQRTQTSVSSQLETQGTCWTLEYDETDWNDHFCGLRIRIKGFWLWNLVDFGKRIKLNRKFDKELVKV